MSYNVLRFLFVINICVTNFKYRVQDFHRDLMEYFSENVFVGAGAEAPSFYEGR